MDSKVCIELTCQRNTHTSGDPSHPHLANLKNAVGNFGGVVHGCLESPDIGKEKLAQNCTMGS